MSAATVGHVYLLRRPDLNKCYVGQSVHTGRRNKHLKPGNYRYDALCADGLSPIVEVVEDGMSRGAELDEAERDWMRAMQEEGWELINSLGPDHAFPSMPFELMSKGGKKGGVIGGKRTAEHRAADPAFDAEWREKAAKAGMRSLQARRAADPDFDAKIRLASTRHSAVTGAKNLAATNARKMLCGSYGYGPTTPAGLSHHQRPRDCSGRVELTSANPPECTENGE